MHDNWLYIRMHQQELLRQAEQIRVAREARGRRKSVFNRMLARLGGLMVAVGEALHRRYAPAKPAEAAFYIRQPAQPVANQSVMSWDTGDASCARAPSEPSRHENGFLNSAQVRRHSPSRKKSNG
jgi:hypothetical protein